MLERIKCKAFSTHYELENCERNDLNDLKKKFSKFDALKHRYIPYYLYDDKHKVLYLPRGFDPNEISRAIGWKPIVYIKKSRPKKSFVFSIDNLPRDDYQREMIRFMIGSEEYAGMKDASQQVLSLPTRSGKTYITIAAISILETRALIIVNSDTLRTQWRSEIVHHTQLGVNNVVIISSSKQMEEYANNIFNVDSSEHYIFVTTHRLIHETIKRYGASTLSQAISNLNIGIKVIDEAHIEFRNTLLTDYFTDVWKTWYLTATFGRTDDEENRIYQRSFNMVNKMNAKNPNRQRSIVLMMMGFCSKPNEVEVMDICYGKTGFNRHKYIEYELREGYLEIEIQKILELVIDKLSLEGRIMIMVSTIDGCHEMADMVKERYPAYSVCCHTSKNKIENFREYGIICATPQMLGTAITIPGLRVVINTEPTSSSVNLTQFIGRLDVYGDGLDTYYFYPMDVAFDKVHRMFRSATKILTPNAKHVIVRDDLIKR